MVTTPFNPCLQAEEVVYPSADISFDVNPWGGGGLVTEAAVASSVSMEDAALAEPSATVLIGPVDTTAHEATVQWDAVLFMIPALVTVVAWCSGIGYAIWRFLA